MTAVVRSARRPARPARSVAGRGAAVAVARAPARVPESRPATRPRLRLVRSDEVARVRRVRRVAALCCVAAVACLVGIVWFHVALAQSQLQLDRYRDEIRAEQLRYERLRADVAAASSPESILARAREQLGMVEPDTITYVEAPEADGDDQSSSTADWQEMKQHLDAGE